MFNKKKMLIAFFVNFSFAVVELVGGIYTNSVAITSDAFHDFCDSLSIGIACYLEGKSRRRPDSTHTYGYIRYSVLGAAITNCILVIGSIAVIYNSILRVFNPVSVHRNGMIVLSVFGIIANSVAVHFTKGGDTLNQKAVNLHMGEDVLCWCAILVGGLFIKLTGFTAIDGLLSFGVGLFILISAALSMGKILNLFLEKMPKDLSVDFIKNTLLKDKDIIDVHHIHVRSIDGVENCATMHIVTECEDTRSLKCKIKAMLLDIGICHATVEFESVEEMNGESGEITKKRSDP